MCLLQHYMNDIKIIDKRKDIGQEIIKLQEQINHENDLNRANQQVDQGEQSSPPSAHIFEIDTLEWEFDLDVLHQNIKWVSKTEVFDDMAYH